MLKFDLKKACEVWLWILRAGNRKLDEILNKVFFLHGGCCMKNDLKNVLKVLLHPL